jgi:hypothetical protein
MGRFGEVRIIAQRRRPRTAEFRRQRLAFMSVLLRHLAGMLFNSDGANIGGEIRVLAAQ